MQIIQESWLIQGQTWPETRRKIPEDYVNTYIQQFQVWKSDYIEYDKTLKIQTPAFSIRPVSHIVQQYQIMYYVLFRLFRNVL